MRGRADFHWEVDGYRDVVDHELLFSTRAKRKSVAWRPTAGGGFPHTLVGANGDPICRPPSLAGALGTVRRRSCRYVDAAGNSRTTARYELLMASEPLRSDRR